MLIFLLKEIEGFVFHEESRGNLNGCSDSKDTNGSAVLNRYMPEQAIKGCMKSLCERPTHTFKKIVLVKMY